MVEIIDLAQGDAHPLTVATTGGVRRITLSNPPVNALSMALMDAVIAALEEAASDPACRAVVIAASGRVFSAGLDLRELTARRADPDGGEAFFTASVQRSSALMQAVVRQPQPVIAAVAGSASAAGCQLVASCDLAIASEEATFSAPGVKMGLLGSTPMVALSRSLAPKHAMEMLLTGEAIDARTAREFGLVNRVVPPEYLPAVVDKYTAAIASKSPSAVRRGKDAFHKQAELGLSQAYEQTGRAMVDALLASDADEGITAFLERRPPDGIAR